MTRQPETSIPRASLVVIPTDLLWPNTTTFRTTADPTFSDASSIRRPQVQS